MISIDLCDGSVLQDAMSPSPSTSPSPRFKSNSFLDSDPDELLPPSIRIYYYPDVFDAGVFEEFDSYVKFLDFCDEKGYIIPDTLEWRLCYLDELHCTSCDLSGMGIRSVVGDGTYNGLLKIMEY